MKMFSGLMPSRIAFWLALPEIGREGDDLAAVGRLQPFENDRSIEAARIGQHHFLDVAFGHSAGSFAKTRGTIGASDAGASLRAGRERPTLA
jgi:hypothetical protein